MYFICILNSFQAKDLGFLALFLVNLYLISRHHNNLLKIVQWIAHRHILIEKVAPLIPNIEQHDEHNGQVHHADEDHNHQSSVDTHLEFLSSMTPTPVNQHLASIWQSP